MFIKIIYVIKGTIMALKTFNLDESIYKKYSSHCKKEGISMSKQIERFIGEEVIRIEQSKGRIIDSEVVKKSPSLKTLSSEHPMHKFC